MPEPTPTYEMLMRLMEGAGVRQLLHTMSSSYLSWSDFLAMRLPSDMSPRELWGVLGALKRASGIEVPIPDIEGNEYWYLRTHEIADSVASIQCLCRMGSDLHLKLREAQNAQVAIRIRIDETIAAALLDGLDIAEADAYALLQLGRTPTTDTEQLVRNTLTVLDDLGGLVDIPFSHELFMHLRYLLLEGVDVAGLKVASPRMGLMTADYTDIQVRDAADVQVKRISDYLNHVTGDIHDHPVLRGLLVPDLFRFYRPLPDLNSQVGRLAYRLYALKTGLPVLGMLPLSRTKLRWEDETLYSSIVTMGPRAYADARAHDLGELTAYTTLALQLTLTALQDLTWSLDQLRQHDDELRDLLQHDPEINHRQRSILGRALRDPSSEFRIAFHKNTHNVVYATARADLLELAEKGFLEIGKRGRAMVFTPRANLREFIEQAYGDDDMSDAG